MLKISDLCCRRDGRVLFEGLCLTLAGRECVELLGPNGSGKSTLLRCVAGLYQDYEGSIEVEPSCYSGHKLGLSPLLTAHENLSWYAGMQGVTLDVAPALKRVGMQGYESVTVRRMSAGQQRRVALARLLVGSRLLWLLDEPLTALDSRGQRLVRELIIEHLARGGAALWATHQSMAIDGAGQVTLGDGG